MLLLAKMQYERVQDIQRERKREIHDDFLQSQEEFLFGKPTKTAIVIVLSIVVLSLLITSICY